MSETQRGDFMAKVLLFGDEARQALARGMQTLASAVRVTLGPRGKTILLEQGSGLPLATGDGVTIAREVTLSSVFENVGVKLLQEVAERTNEATGDGTTTAVVLAQKMVEEGMKALLSLHNPMWIRRGMEKALGIVLEKLKGWSVPLDDERYIFKVASIAARDDFLGELIASALQRVGRDGIITVEESKITETTLEVVEGMEFERGFLSPYFVTDPERNEAILENPFILISDYKIHNALVLLPLLERILQTGRPLFLIVDELGEEALAFLVVNKLRGAIQIAAVKAPEFGERQKEVLGDIAALSGGQVVLQDLGMKLEKVPLELLGEAERVRITEKKTTIIGSKGKQKDIEERIRHIRTRIEGSATTYEKEWYERRLASILRKVAIIRVGAPTEVELKKKKQHLENALGAVRAALEEGVVPGGGTVFLRIAEELREVTVSSDERVGFDIVRRALEEPVKQIAANAGYQGPLVAEKVKECEKSVGFDALQGTFVDMFKAGIVDPAKVLRVALQNATSIASLVLTTETIIAETQET